MPRRFFSASAFGGSLAVAVCTALVHLARAQSAKDGAPTQGVIWLSSPGDCILAAGTHSRVTWGAETLPKCQEICEKDRKCWAVDFSTYNSYPRCKLLIAPPAGATPKQAGISEATCSIKASQLSRYAFNGRLGSGAMGSHTPVARCMATFNMQAGDYNGCDFQGLKMSGTDFSKASGVGTTFSFATLLGFQARESNLRGAMFERTEAQTSKFDFADMSDSMCIGANFRDASMEGVTLTNAKLADAHLDGAVLTKASLQNVDGEKAS